MLIGDVFVAILLQHPAQSLSLSSSVSPPSRDKLNMSAPATRPYDTLIDQSLALLLLLLLLLRTHERGRCTVPEPRRATALRWRMRAFHTAQLQPTTARARTAPRPASSNSDGLLLLGSDSSIWCSLPPQLMLIEREKCWPPSTDTATTTWCRLADEAYNCSVSSAVSAHDTKARGALLSESACLVLDEYAPIEPSTSEARPAAKKK